MVGKNGIGGNRVRSFVLTWEAFQIVGIGRLKRPIEHYTVRPLDLRQVKKDVIICGNE